MNTKAYEWYAKLIDVSRSEIDNTRNYYFENAKLHIAIMGGLLALASYAVTKDDKLIYFFALIVCLFGIFNAYAWKIQIESLIHWQWRWLVSAMEIEGTEEFRLAVGVKTKVCSHPEIRERLELGAKLTGATPRMQKTFVVSLFVCYVAIAAGLMTRFF